MRNHFAFPLHIQLPYMPFDADFEDVLRLLRAEGFAGVELNLLSFDDPEGLRRLLSKHGLRLSMVASGAYAKQNGLSLSAPDDSVREAAIAAVRQMLSFAEALGAGVICGFMKGGAGQDENAAVRMTKSLNALPDTDAPLYIEATNHYEATLANTLAEGVALIAGKNANLRILPDTYHMNIEESGMEQALLHHAGRYQNLHLSDNNRYFPGFGALDFRALYRFLRAMNYNGATAIEGRPRHGLREDIVASARYLAACSEGI